MRSFIFRLRAMILFAKVHPHIDFAPEWTEDDSKNLSKFLSKTPAGAKFRKILFHHVQNCAKRAVIERNHSIYECGYAAGAQGLAAIMDSLLYRETKPEPKTETDAFISELPEDLQALIK